MVRILGPDSCMGGEAHHSMPAMCHYMGKAVPQRSTKPLVQAAMCQDVTQQVTG